MTLSDASSERTRVYVLQSRQSLTTDPADSFPADRYDVVVVTDGAAEEVLREDVQAGPVTVVRAARDEWDSVVTSMSPDAVEIVTNDEYCVAACARLRDVVGLPRRHPTNVHGYLDKVVMKCHLAAAGVPVPQVVALEPVVVAVRDTAVRAVSTLGLPAVAKPRREADSRGVETLEDAEAVQAWLARHDG